MGLFSKLQNGDTQFKSLKFGNDRPSGGDSGQPFIKNPIDKVSSPSNADFLLRGGINAPLNAADDVSRLTKYFFNPKSPSGLLFIAKQNLLSRSSVKTEASKGILNDGIYTPISTISQAGIVAFGGHLDKQGILGNTSNYGDIFRGDNGSIHQPKEDNRLLNIAYGINGFDGTDIQEPLPPFNQKGYNINPTKFVGSNILISYGGGPGSKLGIGKTHIKYADQRTGTNNPLSVSDPERFYKKPNPINPKGLTREETIVNYNLKLGASIKQNLSSFEKGIKENGDFNTLFSPQIPYSTLSKDTKGLTISGSEGYQIGNDLKLQTQKTDSTYVSLINKRLEDVRRNFIYNPQFISISGSNSITWENSTNEALTQYTEPYSSKHTLLATKQAQYIDGPNEKYINANPNVGYLANLNRNFEYNTTINNPLREGGRGIAPDFRKVNRERRGFKDPSQSYDYITESTDHSTSKTVDKIYYTNGVKRDSTSFDNPNDLIDFNFTIINPSNTQQTGSLKFRAYIDSFSDSYSAGWKDQTYMGRAEKFHKYSSFERDISLSFTAVADNETNLEKMYESLSFLASSIAPTYTTQGYMAGNLHKLTVGNYIKNQVGIMSGFTFDVDSDTPWGIKPNLQLPYYIKVTGIKFTPIHNSRPETLWNDYENKNGNFINQKRSN